MHDNRSMRFKHNIGPAWEVRAGSLRGLNEWIGPLGPSMGNKWSRNYIVIFQDQPGREGAGETGEADHWVRLLTLASLLLQLREYMDSTLEGFVQSFMNTIQQSINTVWFRSVPIHFCIKWYFVAAVLSCQAHWYKCYLLPFCRFYVNLFNSICKF